MEESEDGEAQERASPIMMEPDLSMTGSVAFQSAAGIGRFVANLQRVFRRVDTLEKRMHNISERVRRCLLFHN